MKDLPPVIFLDIDGVLNRHEFDEDAQSCTVNPECVRHFNALLAAAPGAAIVLSSAWRYMVHGGAMTLTGFEYMMRTHGVRCLGRVVGLTCPDEEVEPRGQQIRHWLNENGGRRPYVVLDDGGIKDGAWYDMGIKSAGLTVVWCNSKIGLTEAGAYIAAAKLALGVLV